MKNNNQSIGLIGLGYWGKNILRNLHNLGAVSFACDSNLKTLKIRREEFPEIKYTDTFSDLLTSPQINAIAISTPAISHYELVRQALLADKDVFVEKPLALNVEDAHKLVELAQEKNKILMVGHLLRYHPAFIKLKELIEKGELGRIQYLYSNRLNIGKLRVEENILWSFAPHDISAILALIGKFPLNVNCFGGDYLNKGIYDTTVTSLEFDGGVRAHIFVSWLHPFKEQKLVVVGTGAMAVFDDLASEKLLIYPHKIEWSNGKVPIARQAKFNSVKIKHAEPLLEELKHFLDCITSRKQPRTDGQEGLSVLKVLQAAEDSLSSYSARTV
ncbi:MAG: Gfo/Idh/MocA family oxidoreductase [Candidatus Omnitrophica bacterium]|nr:Gfo/Idh/MocA family oxidoreductase [Candidatus Omnitrophota bacterium]